MFGDVFGWMIRGDNTEIVYIHDLSICGKLLLKFQFVVDNV